MKKNIAISLGQNAPYPQKYDPSLLAPIPRAQARDNLLPTDFSGCDIWTAYELSWLDTKGKPQVAIAEFTFSSDSINIIESKSFKYYLNSLNQAEYPSWKSLQQILTEDLAKAAAGNVNVELFSVESYCSANSRGLLQGRCVDSLSAEDFSYEPNANLLQVVSEPVGSDILYSHLLKSNCPVTGQPDWATLWVKYSGNKILPESFLRYVVSYRQHQDFHESCVEKVFADIQERCKPKSLTVYARYTRRGGLDINPFRTNCGDTVPGFRFCRQ